MGTKLELLDRLAKLCQERAAIAERMYREVLTPYDVAIEEFRAALRAEEPPAAPKPTEEEQAILDLWDGLEDGAKLSTGTIAKMLDDSPTNGKLKRTLADMTKRGLLRNDGSGYYPTSPKCSNG